MASKAYGIDFGTSDIKIYRKGDGIVFNQKNIIAIANETKVIAIGDEAFEMHEKAPANIVVDYPIKNGVIANIANMLALLNRALLSVCKSESMLHGATFYVAVPTAITEVEKRAFYDLVSSSVAKSKHVLVVEKPIADALGIGLDVTTAHGVMVVNVGADTTEISTLSLGGMVNSILKPIGGNILDEDIISCVRLKHNLLIGSKTAQVIKTMLATAMPDEEPLTYSVYGRDIVSGLPVEKEIDSNFVYESCTEHLHTIVDAVRVILESTPPEISSDIVDSGIYLTGGSANIRNLDKIIAEDTELDVNVVNDCANSVINGLGTIIETPQLNSLGAPIN
jgi:rod shape-determining protein MreB